MKIEANRISVTIKNNEGAFEEKTFAKAEVAVRGEKIFESADIINMSYGNDAIAALRIRYPEEKFGSIDLVCEIFPLEYVSIHITGRRC